MQSSKGFYKSLCTIVKSLRNALLTVVWINTFVSLDSSGFEHVFVGETRSGTEILGFHNWIQFYLQEKSSHLDYKGYKARDHDLVS